MSRRHLSAAFAFCIALSCLLRPGAAHAEQLSARQLENTGFESSAIRMGVGDEQGPKDWFMSLLELEVVLRQPVRAAHFVLEASVNGFSSNEFQGWVDRDGKCGSPETIVHSVDLFRGSWRQRACGRKIVLRSRNYIQNRSVRPGPATVRVAGEDLRGTVRSVAVRRVGISRTEIGPGRLAIEPERVSSSDPVGRWVAVPVVFRNLGDRYVRRIKADAYSVDTAVDVRKSMRDAPRTLAPHSSRVATLYFRARAPGKVRVMAAASCTTNSPVAEIITYPSKQGDGRWVLVLWLVGVGAGGAGIVGLSAYALARWRRREA